MMVARYSGGDDIITFPLPASGKVDPLLVRSVNNTGPNGKFDNPLDLAQDPATGNLYVSTLDYPTSTIELLRAP
jgi:hypothetical protein